MTVLALLPTVTGNILEALPVEQLTHELQQQKAERLARIAGDGAPSDISSGAPSIRDGDAASLSSLQSSSFIHASQVGEDGSAPERRMSKAQLWNDIKISSITRAFTLFYTLSLLTLLTRIQLNLLGRLNYIFSVVSLAQPPARDNNSISLEDHDTSTSANFGNDFETNRRYLTFSWFFLHKGYATLLAKVQEAVTEVFNPISPAEALTSARFSDLALSVRKRIEGSTEAERHATRWLPYLLPPREDEEKLLVESGVLTPPTSSSPPEPKSSSPPLDARTSQAPLRHLLDETADLIDSPIFTRIHTLLLNALFSQLIDTKVAEQAFHAPPPSEFQTSSQSSAFSPRPQEFASATTVIPASPGSRVKLATILAVLTRQAHAISNGNNPPNEYMDAMESDVKELEAFAAVIYANNLDVEVTEARPRTAERTLTAGAGAESGSGSRAEGELFESQLEGAWSRVMGTSSLSR